MNPVNNMQQIDSWKDAEPFAGMVVAYQTPSFYFNEPKERYTVGDLSFGYVNGTVDTWSSGETGGSMENVLKPSSVPSNFALIPSKLKNASFKMRKATVEEVTLLSKAVNDGEAKLTYSAKDRTIQLFAKYIESQK